MTWNIAPEYVSTITLCIIWIYSRRGTSVPGLRDRVFQACFLVTFCAMTSDILSAWMILQRDPALATVGWFFTLVYFLAMPLTSLVYFCYTLANVYDPPEKAVRWMLAWSVPGLVYAVMAILPPWHSNLFVFTADGGYGQGYFIGVGYLVFSFYFVAGFFLVLAKWRQISPSLRGILLIFPLVAMMVRAIQFFLPHIILSGSAATCALLVIYLFLQNKENSIDSLTGIANRQSFMNTLEQNLRKTPNAAFAIVVLSLKEFKLVNDTYGQHSGDALLAAVGGYLRRDLGLRENQLYRYSGDEFAVLLEEGAGARAEGLVARMVARMTLPWETESCVCHLNGAFGVVRYPASTDSVEGLIGGIESSISEAKAVGDICYCDAALLERVLRRQQIAVILKECLEQDRFEVYYQPILDVESGRFVTAEALLRLNDSPLGSISPAEFIPIAEECGLIIRMTYLVLEKVCRVTRRLLDLGLEMEGINVNISAVQFTQPDLVEKITEIVNRCNAPFPMLKLEITESTLAENSAVVNDFINKMHGFGVRIGLDDFGTGYSNLTSVTDLPLDVVKLDKSLVWSAVSNQRSSIIVQNLTRAFRQLGITVLAEGVETEEQSRFVTRCGCRLIQGFLYAKPMEEDQFVEFLGQRRAQKEVPAQI